MPLIKDEHSWANSLPPIVDGYRWIGNSDYDTPEEARRAYSELFKIPEDKLYVTENTSSEFRWAVYKKT
jgi:hypothetical protein